MSQDIAVRVWLLSWDMYDTNLCKYLYSHVLGRTNTMVYDVYRFRLSERNEFGLACCLFLRCLAIR